MFFYTQSAASGEHFDTHFSGFNFSQSGAGQMTLTITPIIQNHTYFSHPERYCHLNKPNVIYVNVFQRHQNWGRMRLQETEANISQNSTTSTFRTYEYLLLTGIVWSKEQLKILILNLAYSEIFLNPPLSKFKGKRTEESGSVEGDPSHRHSSPQHQRKR